MTIRAHRRRPLRALGGLKAAHTMHERRHRALIPACDRAAWQSEDQQAGVGERSSWFRPIPGAAIDEVLAALAGASTLRFETSVVIANTGRLCRVMQSRGFAVRSNGSTWLEIAL